MGRRLGMSLTVTLLLHTETFTMPLETLQISPPSRATVCETATRWFVLHTRSRQEKALAEDLQARRIEYFLPLVSSIKYYGRRKFRVEVPLFPGYLFLLGTVEQSYQADRTERVARIIQVADQPRLFQELSSIREALERHAPLQPCELISTGMEVEVVAGPFKGIRGVVEQGAPNNRLLLQIDLIGKAAVLEIDRSLLIQVP
jgi:transcriptional antiterminator RfaH